MAEDSENFNPARTVRDWFYRPAVQTPASRFVESSSNEWKIIRGLFVGGGTVAVPLLAGISWSIPPSHVTVAVKLASVAAIDACATVVAIESFWQLRVIKRVAIALVAWALIWYGWWFSVMNFYQPIEEELTAHVMSFRFLAPPLPPFWHPAVKGLNRHTVIPTPPMIVPPPSPKPKLYIAFYTLDMQERTQKQKTEVARSNVVAVDYMIINDSDIMAVNTIFWIRICSVCKYAEEPPGLQYLDGEELTERQGRIGTLYGGTQSPKMTIKIAVPENAGSFVFGFAYSCDTCAAPASAENFQKLTVDVMRPATLGQQ